MGVCDFKFCYHQDSYFNVTTQFMMMDNLLDYIQIAKGYSISVS